MKMPRWLVACLISVSVLSSLAAGVWWWLTWPDRTAANFLALGEAGRFEESNGNLSWPREWDVQMPAPHWETTEHGVALYPALFGVCGAYGLEFPRSTWSEYFETCRFDPPSVHDRIIGRRVFHPSIPLDFTVTRDKILVWPDMEHVKDWLDSLENDRRIRVGFEVGYHGPLWIPSDSTILSDLVEPEDDTP